MWAASAGLKAFIPKVNATQENCGETSHAHGHAECIKALIAAGADVDAKDDEGFTALRMAEAGRGDEVAVVLRNASAKLKMAAPLSGRQPTEPTIPTLICSKCGKTYRIGDDAVAIAVEYAYGLVNSTVIISDGNTQEREDLVAVLDAAPEKMESAREKARQNLKIIKDSLARGQSRNWRCRACDKVNFYSNKFLG
jgi:hypothetical protein